MSKRYVIEIDEIRSCATCPFRFMNNQKEERCILNAWIIESPFDRPDWCPAEEVVNRYVLFNDYNANITMRSE